MRTLTLIANPLAAAGALALLTGCSGGGGPGAPVQSAPNPTIVTGMTNGRLPNRSGSLVPLVGQSLMQVPNHALRIMARDLVPNQRVPRLYVSSFANNAVYCYDVNGNLLGANHCRHFRSEW